MIRLLACAQSVATPVVEEPELAPLSDARLLRRMSLDLRGTLPTESELDSVAADPAQLEVLRDGFLADERLEERLISFWAERFRTRVDTFQVRYYDYGLAAEQECAFERSVGEEPLRLLAHVATNDLPWSEAVTADYTIADEMLAGIWPIAYPEGATGWQVARYTDGRPAAGVLGTNGLWWRYYTSQSNANRSRVAALADLLLCVDFLARPVSFSTSPSLADEDGTAAALKSDDACLACHATIEPLAATLFGFYPAIDYSAIEHGSYHPEREALGAELLSTSPAYFGQPLSGYADLGAHVASDSRFYSCAAETMARMLWRREVQQADFATVAELRAAFGAGGWKVTPLVAAVTDTAQYRAGAVSDEASDETVERELTTRMLSADQLDSAVYDLTGFRWEYGGCNQLQNDDVGYRVLAGGADGDQVTAAQQDPGLTWALVVKRLAQGAAEHAVANGKIDTGDFDGELDRVYRRLFARLPTDAEREADAALIAGAPDVATGWTVLLSTLLRDPEFVSL